MWPVWIDDQEAVVRVRVVPQSEKRSAVPGSGERIVVFQWGEIDDREHLHV